MFFLEQMGTQIKIYIYFNCFLSLLPFSLSFGKKVNKSADITLEA